MTDPLQPLRDWLGAHPDPGEPVVRWCGGQDIIDTDGVRVTTLPWPEHGRAIPALWRAMKGFPGWRPEATGGYLDVTHGWLRAHRKRTVAPDNFARMDRPTVLNFLRWIDRGEKFCDGHWVGCYKQGLIHAAVRALIALGSADPPSPPEKAWRQRRLL